jgi:alpha-glucosidase
MLSSSWAGMPWTLLAFWVVFLPLSSAEDVDPAELDACPGYRASNIKAQGGSLTADLTLAGTACNVFGDDLQTLSLTVDYETRMLFDLHSELC